MTQGIAGTVLLDPQSIDDPADFYGRLRVEAPVWEVPGTGVFTVSTFELVAEATGRVEDFSSNITCLLYRDADDLPARLRLQWPAISDTSDGEIRRLHATHRAPCSRNWWPAGWSTWKATSATALTDGHRRGTPTTAGRVHDRDRQRRADHDDQSPHRIPATSIPTGCRSRLRLDRHDGGAMVTDA